MDGWMCLKSDSNVKLEIEWSVRGLWEEWQSKKFGQNLFESKYPFKTGFTCLFIYVFTQSFIHSQIIGFLCTGIDQQWFCRLPQIDLRCID